MDKKTPFASPLFSARSVTVIMVVAVLGYMVGMATIDQQAHSEDGASAPAPVLTLPKLTGGEERLPGAGWTLVHFWATWCGPCVAELPTLQAMADDMTGRLTVTTVNVDELDAASVARWMAREKITLPTLLDPDGVAMKSWGIVSLPASFLVDPQGMVVGRAEGARDWQDESVREFLTGKMGG